MRRLRIGYLTTKDPNDRVVWSGLIHNMYVALGSQAGDVERVGAPLPLPIRLLWHGISRFRLLLGQKLGIMHNVPLSMSYGLWFTRAIRKGKFDVIFAPISASELGYLCSSVPVCFFSDSTFHSLEGYYYTKDEIGPLVSWQGNYLQRRTIHNADALIFTSDWAADSAVCDYSADPAKIHVIPFGANIAEPPARESLGTGSSDGICRLLFVSVDWNRKRGSLVYETMLALRRRKINAELTVVGCNPSPPIDGPGVHVVPFLNKGVATDAQELNRLYREADFFVLPTRAECFGVVFCEASAFGVPSISTYTGGVPSAVAEGRNGFLLPPEAGAEEYADAIAAVWLDPARYAELRKTTRQRYEDKLNWQAWAESVRGVLEQLVANTDRSVGSSD